MPEHRSQPPPLLILVNGDVDGDNEVTLFDFGLLVQALGSTPGDPNWNPDADLDGDDEVTLFDHGILVKNFGQIGYGWDPHPVSSPGGPYGYSVRVVLGDWLARTERLLYVVLQFHWRTEAGVEGVTESPPIVVLPGHTYVDSHADSGFPSPVNITARVYNDPDKIDVSHWLVGILFAPEEPE